ncbi:MAG: TRL domain-containing protein, partial [Spirochaetales bacterium]
ASCTTFLPGGVSTGSLSGSKVGEATATVLCGFPMGDASIQTAAANGGISNVASFDVKLYTITPAYMQITTIVTGN